MVRLLVLVSPVVRLTGLVLAEVTAAGRRARVQVLATDRRLDGWGAGYRILRWKREQRLRGFGRMTNSAAGVVHMVLVMVVMAVVVLIVLLLL